MIHAAKYSDLTSIARLLHCRLAVGGAGLSCLLTLPRVQAKRKQKKRGRDTRNSRAHGEKRRVEEPNHSHGLSTPRKITQRPSITRNVNTESPHNNWPNTRRDDCARVHRASTPGSRYLIRLIFPKIVPPSRSIPPFAGRNTSNTQYELCAYPCKSTTLMPLQGLLKSAVLWKGFGRLKTPSIDIRNRMLPPMSTPLQASNAAMQ